MTSLTVCVLHDPPPARVHTLLASFVQSEIFGSVKCDCKQQLEMALRHIAVHSGVVIYLQQEGRGIGLDRKIAAYHAQESLGLDTVDANRYIGAPDEARTYEVVPGILQQLGVGSLQLMTNNPFKLASLTRLGVAVEASSLLSRAHAPGPELGPHHHVQS